MKREKKLYNKNEAKREMLKMFLIMLAFAPVLILLNFTIFKDMSSPLRIFLDVVLCLGFIFVVEVILKKIAEKRQEKSDKNMKGKGN